MERTLLDTSVLVAALVRAHANHKAARPWLERMQRGEIVGVVSSHSLLELYAVLTRLPLRPRISPETAWSLIRTNLLERAALVHLPLEAYITLLDKLAKRGVRGGATYDALILEAGLASQAHCCLTLNIRDFRRLALPSPVRVVTP